MNIKGKNFSCNNCKGLRKKSDLYETPYSLTRLLLDRVKLQGSILEPSCGHGAIVKVLTEYSYKPKYYDLVQYNNSYQSKDFLTEKKHFDTIITNPPFSLAYQFIQHSKQICNEIFFLLPLSYLHGKQRYDNIYTDKSFPLKKIYVFTRYPMLGEKLNDNGKLNTGMIVYCWMQFTKGYTGNAEIDWIDINSYIQRKNDKKQQAI
jgi:phospholipid N-methyltransferase